MLSAIMLYVVMLSVVMLNVAAPFIYVPQFCFKIRLLLSESNSCERGWGGICKTSYGNLKIILKSEVPYLNEVNLKRPLQFNNKAP
jgi:hypothetical protein